MHNNIIILQFKTERGKSAIQGNRGGGVVGVKGNLSMYNWSYREHSSILSGEEELTEPILDRWDMAKMIMMILTKLPSP